MIEPITNEHPLANSGNTDTSRDVSGTAGEGWVYALSVKAGYKTASGPPAEKAELLTRLQVPLLL